MCLHHNFYTIWYFCHCVLSSVVLLFAIPCFCICVFSNFYLSAFIYLCIHVFVYLCICVVVYLHCVLCVFSPPAVCCLALFHSLIEGRPGTRCWSSADFSFVLSCSAFISIKPYFSAFCQPYFTGSIMCISQLLKCVCAKKLRAGRRLYLADFSFIFSFLSWCSSTNKAPIICMGIIAFN